MMRRARHRARTGFTLMESIATITVIAVLGSFASTILLTASDGFIEASLRGQLNSEAAMALDRLTNAIRDIPRDESGPGVAPDIDRLQDDRLEWASNSGIELEHGQLLFTDAGGPDVALQNDVVAWTVRAYDESNVLLDTDLVGSECDPIRRLELTLTVARHGVEETLRTRVFIRSTMSGSEGS